MVMGVDVSEGGRLLVVSGVSGAGKSIVGMLVAQRLDLSFAEGDVFHPPANVAKMASGIPLDDDDRAPWLDAIAAWLRDHAADGGVITCSALKRRYRDRLRAAAPTTTFVQLIGAPDLLAARISTRTGHFMPPELLASQLADLDPLAADEPGISVDVEPSPVQIVDIVVHALAR